MTAGETDLALLLKTLEPTVRPGEFVLVSLVGVTAATVLQDVVAEATIVEEEGITFVVRREVADGQGWAYDFVAGWVTLQVHSALAAVGLTAAVSSTLAAADIPANVIAGFFHDHVLVPVERVEDAVATLRRLSASS
jgi:hypothetical protein